MRATYPNHQRLETSVMSFTYFTPGACENLFSRGFPNSQWRQEKVLVAGSSQTRTAMQNKGEIFYCQEVNELREESTEKRENLNIEMEEI